MCDYNPLRFLGLRQPCSKLWANCPATDHCRIDGAEPKTTDEWKAWSGRRLSIKNICWFRGAFAQINSFKRILHDFPDFKDEQAVREKSNVVVLYYNGLIKAELRSLIEKAVQNKAGARLQTPIGNGYDRFRRVTPLEWQHLSNNPLMISRHEYANSKAVSETISYFGPDTRGDGYQGRF